MSGDCAATVPDNRTYFPVIRDAPVIARHRDSAHDPEPEMRGRRGFTHAHTLELDVPPAGPIEQPHAVAQQHRGDEHEDLVENAGVQALAGYLGAEAMRYLQSFMWLVAGAC